MRCPRCSSDLVARIVYGAKTEEGHQKLLEQGFFPGGCGRRPENRHCRDCGFEWRHRSGPPPLAGGRGRYAYPDRWVVVTAVHVEPAEAPDRPEDAAVFFEKVLPERVRSRLAWQGPVKVFRSRAVQLGAYIVMVALESPRGCRQRLEARSRLALAWLSDGAVDRLDQRLGRLLARVSWTTEAEDFLPTPTEVIH
jgi:hypothetical protein